jgi:hypothetical protein
MECNRRADLHVAVRLNRSIGSIFGSRPKYVRRAEPNHLPANAPNILIVLLDDVGFGLVAAKPAAPQPQVPDEPIVATWRDCVGRALQNYEESHDLHALQVATGSCQVRLEEQGGASFTADAGPPVPRAVPPQMDGRRNIGCGWWTIGSDADRDCAAGGRPF